MFFGVCCCFALQVINNEIRQSASASTEASAGCVSKKQKIRFLFCDEKLRHKNFRRISTIFGDSKSRALLIGHPARRSIAANQMSRDRKRDTKVPKNGRTTETVSICEHSAYSGQTICRRARPSRHRRITLPNHRTLTPRLFPSSVLGILFSPSLNLIRT